jgi:Flp pilus assembly protein TadG
MTSINQRNSVRRRRQREGAIIFLLALILPVLLVIVGFSVDLANMQRIRTELRSATDLASKAAADELSKTGDMAKAIIVGKQVASLNSVGGKSLTLADSSFVFGTSAKQASGSWSFTAGGAPLNSVRVTGDRSVGSTDGPVGLFFGSFYGTQHFEPVFSSTASLVDVDICLVLDRSSSMKLAVTEPGGMDIANDPRACMVPQPGSKWAELDAAVTVFLDELDTTISQEQVAMVTFGGDFGMASVCGGVEDLSIVSRDKDLTFNLDNIRAAMTARSNTIWNGNTDIAAGMREAETVLTSGLARNSAQQIMIVLTDGLYSSGTDDPAVVATDIRSNYDITIHTITFSDAADQSSMQNTATNGGGLHHHAPDAATLQAIFQTLAGAIAILTE